MRRADPSSGRRLALLVPALAALGILWLDRRTPAPQVRAARPSVAPTRPAAPPPPPPGAPAPNPPACRYPPVQGIPALSLTEVATGLDHPVFLTSPPGDPRLFVVQAGGSVVVLAGGEARKRPFVDLAARVAVPMLAPGDGRGLDTIAFHPRYASTGRLYASYLSHGNYLRRTHDHAHVVELRASPDPDVADPESVRELLDIELPFDEQGAGMLAFGADGDLYVGRGDGGGAGDPLHEGQRTDTLLGKLLRVDVDDRSAARPYGIPAGNLVGARVRREIWDYGLHRPERFSFDRLTGELWIGEIGEVARDEIDYEAAGDGRRNYGWNVVEGTRCFEQPTCDADGLTPPELELAHEPGCGVVGGYVYRGCRMPGLSGRYFFGTSCTGKIRSLEHRAGDRPLVIDLSELSPVRGLRSFGEDADGELYVVSSQGTVFRIEPR